MEQRRHDDETNPPEATREVGGRAAGTADTPPGARGSPGRNHPWEAATGGERAEARPSAEASARSPRTDSADATVAGRRDLYERPEIAARDRATELQAALKPDQQGRVTMASGVVEAPDGSRHLVAGTSEHRRDGRAYVRPEVAEAMGPRAEPVANGTRHAEQNIVSYANDSNVKVVTIGAGRPVCGECATAIESAGGRVATPKKQEG